MTQVEVRPSATNALGRVICVLDGDPRGAALIEANGNLNPASLAMWGQLVAARSWDLIVDVGANYGEMLLGVELPGSARVVAFEPDDAVRACLEASLSAANIAAELRPEAVAATIGEAEFIADPTWSGTSRLATQRDTSGAMRAVVPTTSLDQVFADSAATTACVKLDVEGAEDLVLEGGAAFFRRLTDVAIMVEILHRTPEQLVAWATQWRMYVFDLRSRGLVRVLPGGAGDVERILSQPWVYRQDAVLRPRVAR